MQILNDGDVVIAIVDKRDFKANFSCSDKEDWYLMIETIHQEEVVILTLHDEQHSRKHTFFYKGKLDKISE